MSFYAIKHAKRSLWWDGKRWRRGSVKAKVYRDDLLPAELPTRNGAKKMALKTDLRWRLGGWGGELVAEAVATLMRADEGLGIEYGKADERRGTH